ncbi:hypothetical protein H4Q26_009504 [Puccinia striiformis f. sp. tritici PST-130]|nr:hypothetical protein H4Q26_009504 [Puccinia striiformis f. sp. tritici PST-130]
MAAAEPKEIFKTLNSKIFEKQEKQEKQEEEGLGLLVEFITNQPYSIHTIRSTDLLQNLIVSLISAKEEGTHHQQSRKLTIDAILVILPRVSSLIGFWLPFLFIGFARILCLKNDNNHSSSIIDLDHSILNLFTFLYGIAPCNFLDFLRNPIDLLHSFSIDNGDIEPIDGHKQIEQLIFRDQHTRLEDLIEIDKLKTLVQPLMDKHRITKNLILMSSITERKEISNRLKLYEPAELIEKCERTLIVEDTKYGSVEELLQESTTTAPIDHPSTDDQSIETLQIENRMLKTQVLLEVYLKSLHLQQLGSVHKQNIQTAGLEAENQNLLRMNKELRKKLNLSNESNKEQKNSKILTEKNKLEYNNLIKQKFLELKKSNLGVLNSNSVLLNRVNELEK